MVDIGHRVFVCVCVLVAQSCLTLCDSMDCSLPGSSVHGIIQASYTGVYKYSLLQRIFPTQELNLSLSHCRQILYWLSWQGKHTECSPLTTLSFRVLSSAAGIPSPVLALFVVMLSKACWLHILGCLALGEWSHHHDYLGRENLFCTVLLCILATSS